jgi:hypothetical protein
MRWFRAKLLIPTVALNVRKAHCVGVAIPAQSMFVRAEMNGLYPLPGVQAVVNCMLNSG